MWLLVATLTGCAVPGEPTVRHRFVPESVHDLAAHQQGDAVVLRFTLPGNSTDVAVDPNLMIAAV